MAKFLGSVFILDPSHWVRYGSNQDRSGLGCSSGWQSAQLLAQMRMGMMFCNVGCPLAWFESGQKQERCHHLRDGQVRGNFMVQLLFQPLKACVLKEFLWWFSRFCVLNYEITTKKDSVPEGIVLTIRWPEVGQKVMNSHFKHRWVLYNP